MTAAAAAAAAVPTRLKGVRVVVASEPTI